MAVVQISKIQVRRGQKNQGIGMPQLASGELGWAIDTRELFIGNGSTAEGAPSVGNTKILTQYDDIFSLTGVYAYRVNDEFITTGASSVSPVLRTLQDRLDDRVSGRAFGLSGESMQDATPLLQRAIDQLFLNDINKGSPSSMVELYLEPGSYTLTDTIYIPPNATIIGAGFGKTIITQTVEKPIFKTVNSVSTPGNPADNTSTTYDTAPSNITIKNLTLHNETNTTGLYLDCCRNSFFDSVEISGSWQPTDGISPDYDIGIGIVAEGKSGAVKTDNNHFVNCKIHNWGYGVVSQWDIYYNNFDLCEFYDLGQAVSFAELTYVETPYLTGRDTGPCFNSITNSLFRDINRYAISIVRGTGNHSQNNRFVEVGNEAGPEEDPMWPVINFQQAGNTSTNDYFSRTKLLSYGTTEIINTKPYVPEINGQVDYLDYHTHVRNIVPTDAYDPQVDGGDVLFRVPSNSTAAFEINYQLVSLTYDSQKTGVLYLSLVRRGNSIDGVLTDEYNYAGSNTYEDKITFKLSFADYDSDLVQETCKVKVYSQMPSNDTSQMKFTIQTKKSVVA